MENEQTALNNHDDTVTDLFGCLLNLATPEEREERSKPDPRRSLHRRLLHLEGNLRKVSKAVFAIADEAEVDQCLLEEYDEEQNGFKLELYVISRSISSMDGECLHVVGL